MVAALGNGRPARRLAVVGVLALTLSGACATESGGGRVTDLTYVSSGGAVRDAIVEAWQKPYQATTPGVRFANTSPPDLQQLRAQVERGLVGWNIVSVAPWQAAPDCGTVYEPLTVVDVDRGQFPAGVHGECFVATFRYGLVFAYNTKEWPDPESAPKAAQDFFDVEKFPGKRGVAAVVADGILEWALLGAGVDPANLYPLDVDRALEGWEAIRPHTVWTATPDDLLRLAATNQVDLYLLPQPYAFAALEAGADIMPVWDVTVTAVSALAIPRKSPYQAEALAFLSYVLRPEQQERIAEALSVAPTNTDAEPALPENGARVDVFGPANTGTVVAMDHDWWSQNWIGTFAEFRDWLASAAE